MPSTTKNVMNTSVCQEENLVLQESSSSDQEMDQGMEVQSSCFQPSTSQAQFVPPMFMSYIEGPKMDLTVNDCLYH